MKSSKILAAATATAFQKMNEDTLRKLIMKTSILSILDSIAATSSRNEKEAILRDNRFNTLLQSVILATYNPYTTYGIKQIPDYTSGEVVFSLDDALRYLTPFVSRQLTGNAASARLKIVLEGLSPEDAIVFARIIGRDLRAGFSDSTANKVWSGLVPTFDVLLCHKNISGIVFPAYAQTKGDGMRCHIYFNGTQATCFTRSGRPVHLGDHFNETARLLMQPGETWDGELVVLDANGKVLPRKTGNGILNKGLKGTISENEISRVRLITWDIVDFAGTIRYDERFEELTDRMNSCSVPVLFSLCYTEIVKTYDEAVAFFLKMRAQLEEGAVIKNFDMLWEGKRVKGAGKMKAEEEADLIVVGFVPGEGKNAGKMGAATCETSDGLLSVNVGIGWSEEERESFYDVNNIGTILTVRYNEKIQDSKTLKWSLFLSRVIEIRMDKTVANTLDELE